MSDNKDDIAEASSYTSGHERIKDLFQRAESLGYKRESVYARASGLEDSSDKIKDQPWKCSRCNGEIHLKITQFEGKPLHQECFTCQAEKLGFQQCKRSLYSTPYMRHEVSADEVLSLCMSCYRKTKKDPNEVRKQEENQKERQSKPVDDHPAMPVP